MSCIVNYVFIVFTSPNLQYTCPSMIKFKFFFPQLVNFLFFILWKGKHNWFRGFPFQRTFFMKDIVVVCLVHEQISPSKRSPPPPAPGHETAHQAENTTRQDGNVDTNHDPHDFLRHQKLSILHRILIIRVIWSCDGQC